MSEAAISVGDLRTVVRGALGIAPGEPIDIEEVVRHTNLNYVFRAVTAGTTLFVKAVPARLKRFGVALPQSRMLDEVRAIRLFRDHAGGALDVPEIAFVDEERFLIAMTDVGGGRSLLADVADSDPGAFVRDAAALGLGLANVHGGTRRLPNLRSAAMDATIRQTIFEYLVVPPPELGDVRPAAAALLADVRDRTDCLVHGDLWPKNIFVGADLPPALIDFEGALMADPSFDLATICAGSLLGALELPALMADHVAAVGQFLGAYRAHAADRSWAGDSSARALRLTGVFIAVRAFGPTAFPMSTRARAQALALATRLIAEPPAVDDYAAWAGG